MKVIWSAEAQARLAAIYGHVTQESYRNAEVLIKRLVERVVQLETVPNRVAGCLNIQTTNCGSCCPDPIESYIASETITCKS